MEFGRAYSPFRALRGAWQLVRRAPATMLLGGVILFLFNGSLGGGFGVSWTYDEFVRIDDWARLLFVAFALAACVVAVALWLFDSLVSVGYASAVERVMSRGKEELGDLLRAQGRWVPMMITRLAVAGIDLCVLLPGVAFALLALFVGDSLMGEELAWVLCVVTSCTYALVLAYVGLGVSLAGRAVAIEGLRPSAALRRSWELVRGHRLRLGTYYVVLWVVGALGIFLCCIGIAFSATLASVAHNESYLRLVRSAEEQSRWWCDGGNTDSSPEVPAPAPDDPEPEPPPPLPPTETVV